jgi:hypothetical protein
MKTVCERCGGELSFTMEREVISTAGVWWLGCTACITEVNGLIASLPEHVELGVLAAKANHLDCVAQGGGTSHYETIAALTLRRHELSKTVHGYVVTLLPHQKPAAQAKEAATP